MIREASRAGIPTAIVSNNSAGAVAAYLSKHGLLQYISPIVGRAYAHPALMKPNPMPILSAVQALRAELKDCVLVGDSPADVEGARAAGIRVIAYANRPWKIDAFRAADVVVTSMDSVLAAVAPHTRGT
ncbi:hypothetical protein GCM10010399_32130 [Dactylosporangium fulvum]